MNRTLAWTAGILIAAMLGIMGWLAVVGRGEDPYAACRTARVAGGLQGIGGDFHLVDETGRNVTARDVVKGPTLVYFGYTYCPDVCPLDSARNAEALRILEGEGIEDVSILFISVDPARDTPEVLAEFTDLFHPRMTGVTGTPDQLRRAAQAFRAYYARGEGEGDDYLMDHSTFTYLVVPYPERGLRTLEIFPRDMTPEEMARRLSCFLEAGAGRN